EVPARGALDHAREQDVSAIRVGVPGAGCELERQLEYLAHHRIAWTRLEERALGEVWQPGGVREQLVERERARGGRRIREEATDRVADHEPAVRLERQDRRRCELLRERPD